MERNNTFDFAKGIACIGVVIMHCSFPGTFGKMVAYMFKFAVPLFFFVSGYFLIRADTDGSRFAASLKRKALKILKYLVCAELLFFLYLLVKGLLTHTGFSCSIPAASIPQRLFWGSFFNGTMWFLYALFWSYVILYLLRRRLLANVNSGGVKTLAVTLLLFHVAARFVARQFYFYDAGMFRNAFLYGLPFILLGVYYRNHPIRDFSLKTAAALCVIGYLGSIAEYLVTKTSLDFYFSNLLAFYVIFSLCVNRNIGGRGRLMTYIGRNLSLYVYVLHMIVIDILDQLCVNAYAKPFAAAAATILLSYFVYRMEEIIKRRKTVYK